MAFKCRWIIQVFFALVSSLSAGNSIEPRSVAVGTLYILNNNPNGSSIISAAFGSDGTIFSPTVTQTGGNGLAAVVGKGQPGVGSLFGADSVVVEDNYLFTVNAGSNTVSMFQIATGDPLHPIMVGQPRDTLGDFPMSVAYSSALSTVCVLNGGTRAGVACYRVDPQNGLTPLDKTLRDISSALNQTTPPVGPFSTTSDIKFNPSSNTLFASVKGSPVTKPVSIGSLYAWPVVNGAVSTTSVLTQNPGLILDFSLSFTSESDLFLTDPAIGGDFLSIPSNLTADVNQPVNITYQKATCWGTYDSNSALIYTADAVQTNITVISVANTSIIDTINFDPSTEGGLDLAIGGSTLFALTQSGKVVSIDISGVGKGGKARSVMTFDPLPGTNLSELNLNGMGVLMMVGSGSGSPSSSPTNSAISTATVTSGISATVSATVTTTAPGTVPVSGAVANAVSGAFAAVGLIAAYML